MATVSTLLSAGIANLVAAFVLVAALVLGPPASATPYWYAWEGDDWPENQGWPRFHGPSGAQATRTLANGQLTIDGLNPPVYDFYRIEGLSNLDPAPGEVFVMQWRMRVDEILGWFPWDCDVVVYSDLHRGIWLSFSRDAVMAPMEFLVASFTQGMFHTYEIRSRDMITYTFTIDGVYAWQGTSFQTVGSPYVAWGDGSPQVSSRSTWDYFRFGVIPEPDLLAMLLLSLGIAGPAWSRARKRG